MKPFNHRFTDFNGNNILDAIERAGYWSEQQKSRRVSINQVNQINKRFSNVILFETYKQYLFWFNLGSIYYLTQITQTQKPLSEEEFYRSNYYAKNYHQRTYLNNFESNSKKHSLTSWDSPDWSKEKLKKAGR